MLPDVWKALSKLGLEGFGADAISGRPVQNGLISEEDLRQKEARKMGNGLADAARKANWDDICLARFLEGVCWRYVAYPVRIHFKVLLVMREMDFLGFSAANETILARIRMPR